MFPLVKSGETDFPLYPRTEMKKGGEKMNRKNEFKIVKDHMWKNHPDGFSAKFTDEQVLSYALRYAARKIYSEEVDDLLAEA